jgi:hypothetical protein
MQDQIGRGPKPATNEWGPERGRAGVVIGTPVKEPAMNRFLRRSLLVACALALAPAQAKVAGSCDYVDTHVDFVDGVAWDAPVDPDDGEDVAAAPLALGFTTFALDAGALARASDRDDALRDQTWSADGDQSRIVVTHEDDAVSSVFVYIAPGTSLSRSGSDLGEFSVRSAGARRIGKYVYADDDGELSCSIEFDIAHLGDPANAPPPPGTPLPADGGEPGRAYLAVNAALRAGDLDALAALLPPARVAMMEEARKSPDFDAQLALMKTMAPTDIRITGGRVDGDAAWVEFTAVEFGSPRAGTAEMIREDGRWFVKSESTRDPD